MKKIDEANKNILALLQDHGRMANSELAERVGLSPAATLDRVKKLESQGVIQKYAALVDPVKAGKRTLAFVAISLGLHSAESIYAFQKEIAALPEVLECYHISGDEDYLLKVLVRDMETYEDFIIHRLTCLENITRVRTHFVMSTVKRETKFEIE